MPTFEPRIVFGMPEDEYHAVPALSASGVKNIRMSPLDFWARASWLNPNHEDDNDSEESFAKTLGTAFHKRILEGRSAFDSCYAAEFVAPPDALKTTDDIKERLRELKANGAPVKLAGSKLELITMLRIVDPQVRIADDLEAEYEQAHEGKTLLAQKYLDSVERAAAMIEKSKILGKAFTGGAAEVSVFWECHSTGVPCKARLDYLKPKAIVDLKTFANKNGYPVTRAVARELGFNRYPIQVAWYYEACDHLGELIDEGRVEGNAPADLVRGLKSRHEKTFLFVFQQKGIAPLAIGRTMPRASTHVQIAAAQCENAKQTYAQCVETFGTDPWVSNEPIISIDDTEIPSLWE